MNSLSSVRTNIFYTKNTKGELIRCQELIFLLDKPSYRYSNEGHIIREREVQEVRFSVSDKDFESLVQLLTKLKDADESELI